jgi:site-specific DNA-methyltransferase (adenine-specific)
MNSNRKIRAPRNRTISLTEEEVARYCQSFVRLDGAESNSNSLLDVTINQDLFEILEWLPRSFVDLLFIDPPYNLTKTFNSTVFKERSTAEYAAWLETWLPKLRRTLKPTASVYICGDWKSSAAIHMVAVRYLRVQNRITWEREKGRGALRNWKNCSEDIWFCTVSDDYTFNVDAVKLKRKVLAPYTNDSGSPKDWERTENGGFRLTHPSNMWTDLSVPFWSMPENTDHPTQKPEKLLAKIILASTNPGDLVLDPFLGSGTTSVVAKKLGRRYCGIEMDTAFACLAEKRLALADSDKSIQGYVNGVFWERNTLNDSRAVLTKTSGSPAQELFSTSVLRAENVNE